VLEAAQIAEEQQISATSSALNAMSSASVASLGASGDGPGKHSDDVKSETKSEDTAGNMPTKQELLSDIKSFISSVDWYLHQSIHSLNLNTDMF